MINETTFYGRYLCFLSGPKEKSIKAVNNLKSSPSCRATDSDSSSDSNETPKALSQDSLESILPKDSTFESGKTEHRRTFSTLGGKKSVKIEEEIIYPTYANKRNGLGNSLKKSLSNRSLKDLTDADEESKESPREPRSRSRSASKSRSSSRSRSKSSSRSESRGRAESRSRSSSRNRTSSDCRFNSNGFSDNGRLSSSGLPFDNTQYNVVALRKTPHSENGNEMSMSHRRSFSRSAESRSSDKVSQIANPMETSNLSLLSQ